MLMNPLFGLALVLTFILTVAFVIYGTYVLAGNANNFAMNLSYRIKRSEQEALIKMPLGILIYDDDHQIQWINPYLQLYLKDDDLIGHTIKSVDPDLDKLLNQAIEAKRQRIDWFNGMDTNLKWLSKMIWVSSICWILRVMPRLRINIKQNV